MDEKEKEPKRDSVLGQTELVPKQEYEVPIKLPFKLIDIKHYLNMCSWGVVGFGLRGVGYSFLYNAELASVERDPKRRDGRLFFSFVRDIYDSLHQNVKVIPREEQDGAKFKRKIKGREPYDLTWFDRATLFGSALSYINSRAPTYADLGVVIAEAPLERLQPLIGDAPPTSSEAKRRGIEILREHFNKFLR